MPTLFDLHPARIIAGLARHGQRIARRDGHGVLQILFADQEREATRVSDASAEIAADAAELQLELGRAAADGIITGAEQGRLNALAAGIERAALTGDAVEVAGT
jgi:hypothetical protein